MMLTNSEQSVASPKDIMRENLEFLKKYARRSLLDKDDTLILFEDIKEVRMQAFLAAGKSLDLTDRDLIVLLFESMWDEHRCL